MGYTRISSRSFRQGLIGCLVVLLLPVCSAGAQDFIWAEWETGLVEKGGPKAAGGLLVYLHGGGVPEADRLPVLGIFVEMAKLANWDILKINRQALVDEPSEDDRILEFVDRQIVSARQDGYRRIFVAGGSRGGWLALLSARLKGVDGVIGLAPGTVDQDRRSLEWQRDELTRHLAETKAPRVAIFFFEGDPLESVPRAVAARQSLQGTQAAYLVVDRPPGLSGHSAAGLGRFTRRYRDCLAQFMRSDDARRREVLCPTDSGYAVGSDIRFPGVDRSIKESIDADKAFRPYRGRWQGDDIYGGYLIVEAVELGAAHAVFDIGYSPPPGSRRGRPWSSALTFRFDGSRQRLVGETTWDSSRWSLRAESSGSLDVWISRSVSHAPMAFSLRPSGQ